MTLEQLKSFCLSPDSYMGTNLEWATEPFTIGALGCATNGHVIVATLKPIGGQWNGLQELTAKDKIENIRSWLAVEIPEVEYSTDHLAGFLGEAAEGYAAETMMFHGQRVDANILRKLVALANGPYRFSITTDHAGTKGNHRLNLQFPKFTALVMGIREPNANDRRYEPKPLKQVVSA